MNHSLSLDHEARLREISKLKAELELRSSTPESPIAGSYFDGWDGTSQSRDSISSETSTLVTTSPVSPDVDNVEFSGLAVPWIKWRGKLYVEKGALANGQIKGCG